MTKHLTDEALTLTLRLLESYAFVPVQHEGPRVMALRTRLLSFAAASLLVPESCETCATT